MSVTDPIADMLTRIRNALNAKHETVIVPASKSKVAIAEILKSEGFIRDYEIVRGKTHRAIKIRLKYNDKGQGVVTGLKRISRPGLRKYVPKQEIPKVYGGLGIAILSTPRGVMTGQQAWRQNVGGEVLCYVW